jgi:hypothetical protein
MFRPHAWGGLVWVSYEFGLVLLVLALGTILALALLAWRVQQWWRVKRRWWRRTWLYVLWSLPPYVGISTRPDLRHRQHLSGQGGGRIGAYVRRGHQPGMKVLFSGPRWLIRAIEAAIVVAFGFALMNDQGNPWR